jgi:hypothetical protein
MRLVLDGGWHRKVLKDRFRDCRFVRVTDLRRLSLGTGQWRHNFS